MTWCSVFPFSANTAGVQAMIFSSVWATGSELPLQWPEMFLISSGQLSIRERIGSWLRGFPPR